MTRAIQNLVKLGEELIPSAQLHMILEAAERKNPWFTQEFCRYAIEGIVSQMLKPDLLQKWLAAYPQKPVNKTIGLIVAGNVPLVGFHDFLCCYVAGCNIRMKLSSKDDELFMFLLKLLFEIDSEARARVEIVDTLKNFDAVIATGSDNTNRYFEYYFRKHPKILRKSRNAVAVLNGNETDTDLEQLADDVFLYFGFGCRNVSKLYLPVDFDVKRLFPAFEKKYSWLHAHNKYMSNYDYQRTILILNNTKHLANEFIMLLENPSIASPIATLHYERWHDENVLRSQLKQQAEKIQCVVTTAPHKWGFDAAVRFGEAQQPGLNDYADGIDTMKFLHSI